MSNYATEQLEEHSTIQRGAISRREFIRLGSRAGLGAAVVLAGLSTSGFLSPGGTGKGGQWYEVVQDARDGRRWHVNLFAGERLGDLGRARHLGRRVVQGSLGAVEAGLDLPARIQFRDGRTEQRLMS